MRLFIVGSGRCGSTLLTRMLNNHPDLYVFPETHWIPKLHEQFGYGVGRVADMVEVVAETRFVDGRPTTTIEPHHRAALNAGPEQLTVREFTDTMGRASAHHHGKSVWADKTPDYGPWLVTLQNHWPDARFLHLVRDGMAVASSMSRHSGFQTLLAVGELYWPAVAHRWNPDRIPDREEIPVDPDPYARLWQQRVQRIRDEAQRLNSGSYAEATYEQLMEDPVSLLTELTAFIGLSANIAWATGANQLIDPKRADRSKNLRPIPGDIDDDVRHFIELERCKPAPSIRATTSSSSLKSSINRHSGVVLVACVRNEELRLPFLLRYYRSLGVGEFHVVDNGSTDETGALLDTQSDVVRHYTEESYESSRFGIDWQNQLLDDHARGRWAVIVDADEQLVYPYCEALPIDDLTQHLDHHDADVLSTPLLDMYSLGPIAHATYQAGTPFLWSCPFYDGDSDRYIGPQIPDGGRRGGPRERLFWQDHHRDHKAPILKKFALVRWRNGLELTHSTHEIRGTTPGHTTGALLHFKFLQDFPARAAEEAERGEHFADARQYRAYDEGFDSNPDLSAWTEDSIRYRDSSQLIERGLIRAAPDLPIPPGVRLDGSLRTRQR